MNKPWHKIIINAGSLSFLQALGDFSGLILYVVLSRYFGPEGIGLYAFGYSIALIAYYIIVFGFDDFGIRQCALIDKPARSRLLSEIVSVQIILLGIVLVSVSIFILISSPPIQTVLVVYSMLFYLIALAFGKIFFVPANSQQRMIIPALAEMVIKLLSVVGSAIAVIVFSAPLHLALLSYPVSGILFIIFSLKSVRLYNSKILLNFNKRDLTSLIKTVWPFSASLIIFPVYTRAGLIILTVMLGNAAGGLYAPSQKFVEVGLMPVIFFCFSVYPVLSKYFASDKKAFIDSAEKFFRAVFIIGALLFWVLFFIIPIAVIPLFGEKFAGSIVLLKYFSVLVFIFSLTKGFHKLLLAANLQVNRIKSESIVLFINLVINILLIPFLGALGAVFALIISESILTIIFTYILYKKSHFLFLKLSMAFKEFLFPFTAAILCAFLGNIFSIPDYYTMIVTLIIFVLLLFISGFIRKFDISLSGLARSRAV